MLANPNHIKSLFRLTSSLSSGSAPSFLVWFLSLSYSSFLALSKSTLSSSLISSSNSDGLRVDFQSNVEFSGTIKNAYKTIYYLHGSSGK